MAFSKINNLKQPNQYKKTIRKARFAPRPQKSLVYDSRPMTIEKKNIDTFFAITAPGGSIWSGPTQLNVIPQGNSAITRTGRTVSMTSIQLRYNVIRGGSNGPSQNRILVVYDKQANSSIPLTTDVFASDAMVSPLNLNNAERFIVLMDELSDSIQSTSLNVSGSRYRKIGLPAIYNGTTGSSSTVSTGTVWLFVANNDQVTSGTTSNNLDIFSRIRYVDM